MKTSLCPCCQALTTPFGLRVDVERGTATWGEISVHLTRYQAIIAGLLARNYGRITSKPEIENALYGLDPNGGPICADKTLMVLMSQLRTALRRAGVPVRIAVYYNQGYEFIDEKSPSFAEVFPKDKRKAINTAHVVQE